MSAGVFWIAANEDTGAGAARSTASAVSRVKVASPLSSGENTEAGVGATRQGRAFYLWIYPNFMINAYEGVMDTNLVLPMGVKGLTAPEAKIPAGKDEVKLALAVDKDVKPGAVQNIVVQATGQFEKMAITSETKFLPFALPTARTAAGRRTAAASWA